MIALLALACAHAPAPPAVTPAPSATPAPSPAPAASNPVPEPAMTHPGTLTFVDPDGTVRERAAADVPDAIAWYGTGAARVPVTRVEASERGGTLEIRRYGADGALLDVTVGR